MMNEENKYEKAYEYAATTHKMAAKYEALVSESLESENGLDVDLLTDYAKVVISYCDALDLLENYPQEQKLYEKVLGLLVLYGNAYPDQFNVTVITYIKYAGVLFRQKKYKKSCEALRCATSILLDNIKSISLSDMDISFINNQLNVIQNENQ